MKTLIDLMQRSFSRYSERTAFTCMRQNMTYRELDEASSQFAVWLQSLRMAPASRIALMLPNMLQYPVAFLGILRAGHVVVNVNPLYTARELEEQLSDCQAEVIVILENFAATLQTALPRTSIRHIVVTSTGDMLGLRGLAVNFLVRHIRKMVPPWSFSQAQDPQFPVLPINLCYWPTVMSLGEQFGLRAVSVQPNDIAVLQYTGGTSGKAKGAVLLHRNLVANTLQASAWLGPAFNHGREVAPITAAALPMYHIFALTVCGLLSIYTGGRTLLVPNARDLRSVVTLFKRYQVHIFPAVNTMFKALLDHSDFHQMDFSKTVVSVGGGMAVQNNVAERWRHQTGRVLLQGYGLSETSPIASCTPVSETRFSGNVGQPVLDTEFSIRDSKGMPLAIGLPGEVCIKGPQVMAGYWQDPEATSAVMTYDGFLRTGDIGVLDEVGALRLVDRKKDMILVSGFNVYPNEIEDVVAGHPGVAEVAAIGVSDERSGEAIKLYIVRRDPLLTETALLSYCRERLTGYKIPKVVVFRNALPKTNVGKILRRALRDESLAGGDSIAPPGKTTRGGDTIGKPPGLST